MAWWNPFSWGQTTTVTTQRRRRPGGGGSTGGGSTASVWSLRYGAPISVTKDATGDWFNIPSDARGVHYLTKATGALTQGKTIRMRFRLDLNGELWPSTYPDEQPPCKMLLFFQRRGDDLSGRGRYEDYRWWNSAVRTPLVNGEFTVETTLDPAKWTSVYGQNGELHASGWSGALANAQSIGATFSGQSFGGHGVYCKSGTAKFTMLEYSVI